MDKKGERPDADTLAKELGKQTEISKLRPDLHKLKKQSKSSSTSSLDKSKKSLEKFKIKIFIPKPNDTPGIEKQVKDKTPYDEEWSAVIEHAKIEIKDMLYHNPIIVYKLCKMVETELKQYITIGRTGSKLINDTPNGFKHIARLICSNHLYKDTFLEIIQILIDIPYETRMLYLKPKNSIESISSGMVMKEGNVTEKGKELFEDFFALQGEDVRNVFEDEIVKSDLVETTLSQVVDKVENIENEVIDVGKNRGDDEPKVVLKVEPDCPVKNEHLKMSSGFKRDVSYTNTRSSVEVNPTARYNVKPRDEQKEIVITPTKDANDEYCERRLVMILICIAIMFAFAVYMIFESGKEIESQQKSDASTKIATKLKDSTKIHKKIVMTPMPTPNNYSTPSSSQKIIADEATVRSITIFSFSDIKIPKDKIGDFKDFLDQSREIGISIDSIDLPDNIISFDLAEAQQALQELSEIRQSYNNSVKDDVAFLIMLRDLQEYSQKYRGLFLKIKIQMLSQKT